MQLNFEHKYNMKRLLLLLIISMMHIQAFAQSPLEKQHQYAESLFEKGLYFDAVTEYKRLLFFDNDSSYIYDANFNIGESYKQGAYFDNAIKFFASAKMNTTDKEEQFTAEIQIIRCNILRKTTDRALELLNNLESNPSYISKMDEINYWRGWTYMFRDEWDKAVACFTGEPELQNICRNVSKSKYSVTFATVISYILPGAGQVYTGHYFSGFMSLGWNALWGYLTIDAFNADRVFDGAVIGSLLWLRFYRGNVQNARKYAENENLKIANKTLNYLQYNYKGTHP